ncbi:MAG: gamma-glutamylcyclotransferase [Chloroflexi bacterium]|nr:gamma-glutamylcyclotransferase [Chloroflexota bacterium]
MYYFAYASNMSRKQMAERCPEAKATAVATLPNFKLIFTGYSRLRKGAVASIRGSKGDKVIGAVYEINEAGLRKLDKCENYPVDYKHLDVRVFTDSGETYDAVTFIKAGQEEEGQPSAEYRDIIQQGYRDWGII